MYKRRIFRGIVPQRYVDVNLYKCPFCGASMPNWKLGWSGLGMRIGFQCSLCNAIISTGCQEFVSPLANTKWSIYGILKMINKRELVPYFRIEDIGMNDKSHFVVGEEYTAYELSTRR